MGQHYKDITGQRFGKLIAKEIARRDDKNRVIWKCICDCGNEVEILGTRLIRGITKSCGCYRKEYLRERRTKANVYDLSGSYGIGYTSNGKEFYFDLEDYPLIKDYCWRCRPDGYFDAKKRDGSDKRILLHNLIMGRKYVDHIGGSGTIHDNRKENLRIPPDDFGFDSYNQMNKQRQSNNKSGYPGVSWHKRDDIWEVHISINKQQIYLGRYENFDEAVSVRKAAEKKYFGEYSYENSQEEYSLLT